MAKRFGPLSERRHQAQRPIKGLDTAPGRPGHKTPGSGPIPRVLHTGRQKIHLPFQPVGDAEERLTELLRFYWQGLAKPLDFFPNTSYAYANNRARRKTESEAIRQTRQAWLGGDYSPGECDDDYYRLCYRDNIPLGSNFTELATKIYEPLIRHQEKVG